MNYPVWELTTIGGGTLIAFIAVLHVFISHLAVGGGLFLWLTDLTAARRKDVQLTGYVRRHTWFFLLLTMVFGGVTGVGIWFIIALVQPAATSSLIHTFVFGWAIEWVFFVGEIVALLVYHYRFTVLTEKDRLRVAFLYFLFAWLSLVVINGILAFMLTPGSWLKTREFWDGFFNPTYFPSLLFRSCMAAMLAGMFGFVTAVRTSEPAFRDRLMRYCARWLLYPLAGLVPSAAWYYFAVPADIRLSAFGLNPQSVPFVWIFGFASVSLFVAGVLLVRRVPGALQKVLTVLVLAIGLAWIGGFEYLREIARKPYIIGGYMYSTSVTVEQAALLDQEGVLPHARWAEVRSVTSENRDLAGRELFRLQCQSCHTIGGIRNDIVPRLQRLTYFGILSQLTGQGRILPYMPPFMGTAAEKEALAFHLAGLNGATASPDTPATRRGAARDLAPPFDARTSEYLLLAWSDAGMSSPSDGDRWFSFRPPGNTLEAQLIKRGDPPALVNEEVELLYSVDSGFETPSANSGFWQFAEPLAGKKLPENTGLNGKGMRGEMDYDPARNSFVAAGIPVLPYSADGAFDPYPVFTVQARAKGTGYLLVETRVVLPASTEIGCRICHGGAWKNEGAGLSDETSRNILEAHDRLSGTDLLRSAEQGRPQRCQSCHPDSTPLAPGYRGVAGFSASMHGWHANYMPLEGSQACALCHPSSPTGQTRSHRDLHGSLGLECTDCHGAMRADAIALLRPQRDRASAGRMLAPLEADFKDSIATRIAWTGLPDCLNCHSDFQQPEPGASGANRWTAASDDLYRFRTDMAGVRCPACHGPAHAVYPSTNPFSRDRDNMQPLQYSGTRAPIGSDGNCAVCHRKPMQDAIHHPNMERPFRNTFLLE